MFAAAVASISILGRQISRNPPAKRYFQMPILIGKSRSRVNIIILKGTSAGAAAAPKTASAELKKHKGSREEMSPGPFGLPARIRRHVGRGNRRERGGGGSGGRVSIRRRGGGDQVGADDALPPQHLGRHLDLLWQVWSHLLPASRGFSDFWDKLGTSD